MLFFLLLLRFFFTVDVMIFDIFYFDVDTIEAVGEMTSSWFAPTVIYTTGEIRSRIYENRLDGSNSPRERSSANNNMRETSRDWDWLAYIWARGEEKR